MEVDVIHILERHGVAARALVERAAAEGAEAAALGQVAFRLADARRGPETGCDEGARCAAAALAHDVQAGEELAQPEEKQHLLVRVVRVCAGAEEEKGHEAHGDLAPLVEVYHAVGLEFEDHVVPVVLDGVPPSFVDLVGFHGYAEVVEWVDGVWNYDEEEDHAHHEEAEEAGSGGVAACYEAGELTAVSVEADEEEDWSYVRECCRP